MNYDDDYHYRWNPKYYRWRRAVVFVLLVFWLGTIWFIGTCIK